MSSSSSLRSDISCFEASAEVHLLDECDCCFTISPEGDHGSLAALDTPETSWALAIISDEMDETTYDAVSDVVESGVH